MEDKFLYGTVAMSERKKIGPRVNAELWDRFTRAVEEKHGSTRGKIGAELDDALRMYLNDSRGPDELARIEDDIATLKAAILGESDGGSAVPSEAARTHTHSTGTDPEPSTPIEDEVGPATPDEPRVPAEDAEPVEEETDDDGSAEDVSLEAIREELNRDERPDPKGSSKADRAEYLAARVLDRTEGAATTSGIARMVVRSVVDDVYGYQSRTADPLADDVVELLEDAGLRSRPEDDRLVTPGRYEELEAELEAELEERAREKEDAMYGSSDDVDEEPTEETSDGEEAVDDPIEAALEVFRTKGGRDDVPRIVAETSLDRFVDDVTDDRVDELLERYEETAEDVDEDGTAVTPGDDPLDDEASIEAVATDD